MKLHDLISERMAEHPVDQNVTHIGMIQTYGLTGETPSGPVIGLAWASREAAIRDMVDFVRHAHDDEATTSEVKVIHLYKADDGAYMDVTKQAIFVTTPGGPSWGMITDA